MDIKRSLSKKEMVHENLGAGFQKALSNYDTTRRVQTLIDAFLPDSLIQGKEALDVGCGLGFFSRRLMEKGARVTACDIGPVLVERVRAEIGCQGAIADALA